MRRFASVAILALLFSSAVPFAQSPFPTDGGTAAAVSDEAPHAWFVQLAEPPAIDGTSVETLTAEADRFREVASAAGLQYTETRRFQALWNGLALTTAASPEALKALPGVVAVYPVVTATRAQFGEDTGPVADMVTALSAAGADVVQNEFGLTGEGVRVAVMDSGIDYHHPDLGGCFGPGCRVAKGWDFVGNAFNPDTSSPLFNPVPVPDADPDDCDGHGTHVAGIIGANGVIRGVAPKVTLHAYRVFGCVGPTTTDVILAAMERAYADGADILNISLGAPYQWPEYPTAASAARLVKKGLIVVASAGNEGRSGLYAADAPGVGQGVISVASFDNSFANLSSATVSPDDHRIGYLVATASVPAPTAGSAPLARTGTTASLADACNPLAPGSLTGQIALVRRGTCGFPVKAANVQAAGALAAVIYNSAPGRISVSVGGGPVIFIPVVSISGEDGALLDQRIAAGPTIFTWSPDPISEPQATGNLISSFSSYGPTPALELKPDLGAPGGAIRSTLPLERGGYGTISGTSMASPYVAGAIALIREAAPGLPLWQILGRLQNTARPRPLAIDPGGSVLEVVHRQGAGLIALDQAVKTKVEARPSRLALGAFPTETGQVRRLSFHVAARRQDLECTKYPSADEGSPNQPCGIVTYTVGHQPAAATDANTFTPGFVQAPAAVEFDRPTIEVDLREPLAVVELMVHIRPPANPSARLFGGYLTFTPDDGGPVLRVPYLGYNGNYQAIQALAPTAAGFPWLAKVIGTLLVNQPAGATYTVTGGDLPIVAFHLDHQVRRLRAEIFEIATGRSFGPIDDRHFVPRNSSPTSFFVLTWTGTYTPKPGMAPVPVPSGAYRIEIKAVKALAGKDVPEHIETWASPPITIVRP